MFKRIASGTQVEIELAGDTRLEDGSQRFLAKVEMSYPITGGYIVSRPGIPGWIASIDARSIKTIARKGAK